MSKRWRAAWEMFRRGWRHLPIVGRVWDVRISDHREALVEAAIILAAATAPTWVSSLVEYAFNPSISTFGFALTERIREGDLFIYTAALGTPIIYYGIKEYEPPNLPAGSPPFPNKTPIVLILVLLIVLSMMFFAALRVKDVILGIIGRPALGYVFRESFVEQISWVLFGACIFWAISRMCTKLYFEWSSISRPKINRGFRNAV